MKEGLDQLFALQGMDDHLRDIQDTLNEIPLNIKRLEKERDDQSEIVARAKAEMSANFEERKKYEREIQQIKDKIAKYKEQMKKVTTNKEYQGFIQEIKFEETNIAGIEEKIIETMVGGDAVQGRIRAAEAEYQRIAAAFDQKIKDLQLHLQYQQDKLGEEKAQRDLLRARVPAPLLKAYDQLCKNKNGKAIALVETEFCGACNIKIRPQLLNDFFVSPDLMICDNCGRILFKKPNPVEDPSDTPEAS
ncbi:MAG TPA: C4-type zinc ribbon domain-containing protein [Candidatus Aminicenantes bacterium]|nr:C4-type zinc ribbon domain-containing protein [Candidatus Aminicenantes bacterium]